MNASSFGAERGQTGEEARASPAVEAVVMRTPVGKARPCRGRLKVKRRRDSFREPSGEAAARGVLA